jgi:hypothetical protein
MASSHDKSGQAIWQIKNKKETDETSHERYFYTQDNDYPWRVPRLRRAGI